MANTVYGNDRGWIPFWLRLVQKYLPEVDNFEWMCMKAVLLPLIEELHQKQIREWNEDVALYSAIDENYKPPPFNDVNEEMLDARIARTQLPPGLKKILSTPKEPFVPVQYDAEGWEI